MFTSVGSDVGVAVVANTSVGERVVGVKDTGTSDGVAVSRDIVGSNVFKVATVGREVTGALVVGTEVSGESEGLGEGIDVIGEEDIGISVTPVGIDDMDGGGVG